MTRLTLNLSRSTNTALNVDAPDDAAELELEDYFSDDGNDSNDSEDKFLDRYRTLVQQYARKSGLKVAQEPLLANRERRS